MTPENYMKRVAMCEVQKNHVFKTLYKTSGGEWTEEITKGAWKPCCNSATAAKTCEIKNLDYYTANETKNTDFMEAVYAWIGNELITQLCRKRGLKCLNNIV